MSLPQGLTPVAPPSDGEVVDGATRGRSARSRYCYRCYCCCEQWRAAATAVVAVAAADAAHDSDHPAAAAAAAV